MGSIMDQERPWEREASPTAETMRERIKDAYRRSGGRLEPVMDQIIIELERIEASLVPPPPAQTQPVEAQDLVDKAVAWDQCVSAARRARAKALEEAAKLIEDNMLCGPDGVEVLHPRSNPGNKVGLAYAAAIRALHGSEKGE